MYTYLQALVDCLNNVDTYTTDTETKLRLEKRILAAISEQVCTGIVEVKKGIKEAPASASHILDAKLRAAVTGSNSLVLQELYPITEP